MKTSELKTRLASLPTSMMNALAEASEVSIRTLWAIRSGSTVTASEATKEKLAHGFRRLPRKMTTKENSHD